MLHRPLCSAIERFGSEPLHQQVLLAAVGALLASPQSQALAALRGGDADPDAAQALLGVVACCLRQACQWRLVPEPGAVEPLLRLGLPLAAANAGCHHRETSQRAVGALGALLALLLAADSPLHAALLGFAQQQGPVVLQGMLLALAAFTSAAHLPKLVGLWGDVAMLAATLALQQQQQQATLCANGVANAAATDQGALLCAGAGGQLATWLAAALPALVAGGVLSSAAADALLVQWDWQPMVQQAVLQLLGAQLQRSGGGGGSPVCSQLAEARRGMQRAVRLLADWVRHAAGTEVKAT